MIEPFTPSLKPMRRIVIIDDDPAFALTFTKMLSSLGYGDAISTDASYVFDLSDDDVVFLDVLMPNTSGLQVLDQLANQGRKSAIVLMSGNSEQLDQAQKYAERLDLNLIGALDKPFRLDAVEAVLEGT